MRPAVEAEAALLEIERRYSGAVTIRKPGRLSLIAGLGLQCLAIFALTFPIILGLLLMLASWVCGVSKSPYDPFAYAAATGLATILSVVVIVRPALQTAAILLAPHNSAARWQSTAPLLLFLRSFPADKGSRRLYWHALRLWMGDLLARRQADLTNVLYDMDVEGILVANSPAHRVVAIGRPTEVFQKPGAARIYAADDTWKSLVVELMRGANAIMVHVSDPADVQGGLEWELTTLRRLNLLERTVFLTVGRAGEAMDSQTVVRLLDAADADISSNGHCQLVFQVGSTWRTIFVDDGRRLRGLAAAIWRLHSLHPAFMDALSSQSGSQKAKTDELRLGLWLMMMLTAAVVAFGIAMPVASRIGSCADQPRKYQEPFKHAPIGR